MHRYLVVIACLAALALSISCSGDLSRSQALEHGRWLYDGPAGLIQEVGKVSEGCLREPGGQETLLSRAGVITVRQIGRKRWEIALTPHGQAIAEKPFSHEEKEGCDYWLVKIPVAQRENLEITGIRQEGNHAIADLVFSLRLNEFGKQFTRENYQKLRISDLDMIELNATFGLDGLGHFPITNDDLSRQDVEISFTKYDDGWR